MSYVDEYARIFRDAADRQARSSRATRLRLHAPRAAGISLAAAAVAAAVAVLPDLRTGERAAAPVPPDNPLVVAHLTAVRNSDVPRDPSCRPPRPGAGVTDAPMAAATRKGLGVLRRREDVPPEMLRDLRRWGDPRATVLAGSLRLLGRPPRALLYVMRGPTGRFIARDPRRCTELMLAELARRTARSSEAVRTGARRALEGMLARDLELLESRTDRIYMALLDRAGRVAGGGGGVEIDRVRRSGMSSSGIHRVRGRQARSVSGLVPDGVRTVEIVARGAGEDPWVRRHRVPVRDNYFSFEGFHAQSFTTRWLDARGREIARWR